ncbi:hypothetical protein KAS08_04475 [Candidatus Pacearchaeota archaeon]|nr:hypothetical protein [Candidatus Pacearchaeota archaeon]
MRIAIDVDEVLTDSNSKLIAFHNEKYGSNLTYEKFNTFDLNKTLGGDIVQKESEFLNSDYVNEIIPLEGSIKSVEILNKNNELFILTSRRDGWQERTNQWLEKYFGEVFEEIIFSKVLNISKGNICLDKKFDLLIEDSPTFSFDAAELGIKVLLLNKPWNQNIFHENIFRCKNWEEIINKIEELK